ncbi:long-chain fatty acid--CoA ligase [Nocardia sp. 2]|uniref:Acyl-CoA synthetase n=2 Tax=Nocardia acididurans TaxID=2802282 RepID=A0ABS1MHB0_9NOCA|nr:AMP-dependent synthetase/ligase [Nocardia acididurans]MBL1079425.1 long-chain fatty acid--CoA ligase [Nocardia acididurans]
MTVTARTLCEAFQATASTDPDAVALRTADNATVITWRDYAARVRRIAAGLVALGVRPGDTVGLMLSNRPEFHVIDTAVLHTGAIPFSIYNTNPPEKIHQLFANAENRIVLCEAQFVDALTAAQAMGGTVERLVCLDAVGGFMTLAELEAAGDPGFEFESTWRAVNPDAPATIIYTSGTTGPPKGVELTHTNVLAVHRAVDATAGLSPADEMISYLPDAHAANRMLCHYASQIFGVRIAALDDLRQIRDALITVRPTVFLGVPQTWYRLKSAIEAGIAERSALEQRLATWALGVGAEVARRTSAGIPIPAALRLRHAVAEQLVLSTLRAALGLDRSRVAISGAAPIAPEAHEFVLGLGVQVLETWGMSECAAVATLNPPDAWRIGTVGPAIATCEIAVAEDGELLIRGPMVMPRYRNDPEQSAAAIDADGWLHSGDIGTVDADGYYRIVGRKKELIINAGGKNMSPTVIEGALRVACPLLGQVVAIGDGRPHVTALVTLDPDAAAAHAAQHGRADATVAALAADPEIHKLVEEAVAQANSKLSRVEQIRDFTIVPEVWEPGGELVTPTLKLRRGPIAEHYADDIARMYP